jgi:adenylate cyclase
MGTTPATFLFADLAGFTALTEAHGDELAADLAGDFSARVRDLVGDRGTVIKTIGDAVMVRFPYPADAIGAGVRIVAELGSAHGAPAIRVGLHHGSAVERDGDWFGANVNVAARLTGLAAGGDVLLTDATRRAAVHVEGVQFASHGTHQLRNISAPVRVLRALPAGASTKARDIDPVCRMAVDPRHAAGTAVHDGRTHRFCSLDCLAQFAADPRRFAGAGK